jgi:hypothetical protein
MELMARLQVGHLPNPIFEPHRDGKRALAAGESVIAGASRQSPGQRAGAATLAGAAQADPAALQQALRAIRPAG